MSPSHALSFSIFDAAGYVMNIKKKNKKIERTERHLVTVVGQTLLPFTGKMEPHISKHINISIRL